MANLKAIVDFNLAYTYPVSISRGYWERYPLDLCLSDRQKAERIRWLEHVNRMAQTSFHKLVEDAFASADDVSILRSIILGHGIFSERFFHRQIKERIVRQFVERKIEPNEIQKLMSDAWGYNYRFSRREKSEAIYWIIDHLYEQTLVRVLNNPAVYGQLESWFNQHKDPETCILCSNVFRVTDTPDWIYFGSNGYQSCCFKCRIVESPKKSELTILVPEFVRACGFIPNSNANPISYAFTSRLSKEQWGNVFRVYCKMGGVKHVSKKFGSWFEALVKTGALPQGVLTTARGIRCLAKDGHVCHSLDEQRIDNWLTENGLAHEREPAYPPHPNLNPTGNRRADWKVGKSMIEYFGLVGDPVYERKMEEKLLLARSLDLELIAIYPCDLGGLEERLGKIIQYSNQA